jgi:uroporphyrin-III C-methyltransferase/precorrin-2 dehydrogenase/sirohydrochlorin ferrochelatase
MHSLPLFHRLAGQPVIVVGEGEAAEAKRRLLERAGAMVVAQDNAAAKLAFVALDQPDAVAEQLKARGLLVNVVDRPELCDFTTPSLLERGPVLVAVSTGGVSAGLAKALRLRLEGLLPATLGALANALNAARADMKARWPNGGDRRRALDAALAPNGPLDPLQDSGDVAAWLEGADDAAGGKFEIALRSADPDDLTLREARWLGSADLVLHEAEVPSEVLNRARADAARQALNDHVNLDDQPGVTVVIRMGPAGP